MSTSTLTPVFKFDGTNYREWRFRVNVAIEAEGLEIEEKPDPVTAVWKKADAKVRKIMIDRMSSEQLELVMGCTDAKTMMDELDNVYSRKNTLKCIQTKRKLLKLNFDEKEDASVHLAKFEKIINEVRASGDEIVEDDIIGYFQLTLPAAYDNVISYFDSLPAADKKLANLKARFVDEWSNRNNRSNSETNVQSGTSATSSEEEKAAFAASRFSGRGNRGNTNFRNSRGNRFYKDNRRNFNNGSYNKNNFYGENNNQKGDSRFYNNNYRNSFRSRNNYGENSQTRKCFSCGKEGHLASSCSFSRDRKVFFTVALAAEKENNLSTNELKFYLDSGATDHMINEKYCSLMTNVINFEKPLKVKSSKEEINLGCDKYGDLNIDTNLNCKSVMKDVLCVKDLHSNLISVSKLDENGLTVTFKDGKACICDGNNLLAVGKLVSGLYSFIFKVDNCDDNSPIANNCFAENHDDMAKLWHLRYGHISYTALKDLSDKQIVNGLHGNFKNVDKIDKCEICILSKQCNFPYNKQISDRSSRPLQLVHTDLICVNQKGLNGEMYIFTAIDDYSSFKVAYPICRKSDTINVFKEFVNYVQAISNYKINMIRCDNGKEYCNVNFKNYCRDNGIFISFVDPYSPQLNSCAERNNRTIVEKARAMLLQSKLKVEFWPYAVETASYILNRSMARHGFRSPVEILKGKKPDVVKLRVFGSIAYNHIPKQFRKKFNEKGEKCIFIGYSNTGYRLWSPITRKIKCARNVVFQEGQNISDWKFLNANEVNESEIFFEDAVEDAIEDVVERRDVGESVNVEERNESSLLPGPSVSREVNRENSTSLRPKREVKIPKKFEDYEITALFSHADARVPETYEQAIESPESSKWQEAMENEMKAMKENEVWSLIDSENVESDLEVDCRWVYSVKVKHNRKVYRARLVARGFLLKDNEREVYSPVAKHATLRTLICVANGFDMKVANFDINTAFLYGRIEDGRDVYMKMPRGFEIQGRTCKLRKSIYGLRDSSRQWNKCINDYLLSNKFVRSKNDLCLYTRRIGNDVTYLLLYVDDIFVVCSNECELNRLKLELSKRFKVSDLTGDNRFLGVEILWNRETCEVTLSQAKYIETVLKKFRMFDCNPVKTPMENNLKIVQDENDVITNKPVRQLIGCLSYIANMTRPDICYAVNRLSQYQERATDQIYEYLKRILRYLKGTINYGLRYRKGKNFDMTGYADADFGSDSLDRKSKTGFVFYLGSNVIAWKSIKQKTVALSTTEAEYVALSTAVAEGIWLKQLLKDLNLERKSIKMYEDNKNVVILCKNGDNNTKCKHIDVRYRFINDKIETGEIEVEYVSSKEQVADVFTKPISLCYFVKHRDSLGINIM